MQFAEEYAARRLNAFAEVERARELELRRVIAERKALAHEERAAARRARRAVEIAAPEVSAVPETVTVETILRSAAPVAVGVPVSDDPASHGESEARKELHSMVR